MRRAKTVDAYIESSDFWQDELRRLRDILTSTGLEETVKWGQPCYTVDGKNVVGIGAFKSYFGLWFFQGALLKDDGGHLINAQEGKTKALRQWRMHTKKDIRPAAIKRYVKEAAALAREGREIKADRAKKRVMPEELRDGLKDGKAETAFEALRPAQQREYANYVAEAKRDDTRQRRVAKILPLIADGVGLNDKYR